MGRERRSGLIREFYAILYIAAGVLSFISLISYNPNDPALNAVSNVGKVSNLGGIVGAYTSDLLFNIFGISAYLFSVALVLIGIMEFTNRGPKIDWRSVVSYTLLIMSLATLIHLKYEIINISNYSISGGGLLGGILGVALERYLNKSGAYVIASSMFVISFISATKIPPRSILQAIRLTVTYILRALLGGARLVYRCKKFIILSIWRLVLKIGRKSYALLKYLTLRASNTLKKREVRIDVDSIPRRPQRPSTVEAVLASQKPAKLPPQEAVNQKPLDEVSPRIYERIDTKRKATKSQLELIRANRDYKFPPISLLNSGVETNAHVDEEELKKNAVLLQNKLKDYDVEGRVTEIHPGPVITMFEFEPAAGVKINKIVGLADDLAVAMGGKSIRIVPHLPGKAAIGIEIPNNVREVVWLKDIISDPKFSKSPSKLTIALGKSTQGLPVVSDLEKMPHLLIAGATGSGKSVAINAMICSILYKALPEEVKLILIDPKTLELPVYNGIPHLLLPVVTGPKDASLALAWAIREMERRYKLLADVNAKNISTYNQKVEDGLVELVSDEEAERMREADRENIAHTGKLPYIVIIIDELADLMMTSSKDIEENITRLAQMARAAGIHLIVATQRPSVDVITGLIKANFPTRIAFKVSSKHDSRTILDGVGAEHLLGAGDMLFMPPNSSKLTRIHGAYITEEEIEKIVAHVKEQGAPNYDESILNPREGILPSAADGEYDELYDAAVKIVAETRQASISMIQRRLRIGYNRAARLIEKMEAEGIVGPSDGSKPREVFISNQGEG